MCTKFHINIICSLEITEAVLNAPPPSETSVEIGLR